MWRYMQHTSLHITHTWVSENMLPQDRRVIIMFLDKLLFYGLLDFQTRPKDQPTAALAYTICILSCICVHIHIHTYIETVHYIT